MSIGSYARFQGTPAHESEGSASTWWHRAANMITAYSEAIRGSVLHRADNADEYFLWALFTPCQVSAGGQTVSEWLPDEHEILTAPAVAISKPPDIHTTQAVTAGERVGLIDFFAPVRWDFSNIDGMVVNRAEYPMLQEQPKSHAGATTVYAASDPRAALNRHAQR